VQWVLNDPPSATGQIAQARRASPREAVAFGRSAWLHPGPPKAASVHQAPIQKQSLSATPTCRLRWNWQWACRRSRVRAGGFALRWPQLHTPSPLMQWQCRARDRFHPARGSWHPADSDSCPLTWCTPEGPLPRQLQWRLCRPVAGSGRDGLPPLGI